MVQVNGKPWPNPPLNAGDELSYADVVKRAVDQGTPAASAYRVRYDGAVGEGGYPVNGRLHEGSSVKVGSDTKFFVSPSKET